MLLRGKIAVITGGTRGIGYATVKKFLENGAKVVLFGSREETVAKALASLRAENPEWEVSGAWPNLVDADEVAAEISKIRETYGRIDILINNAGISDSTPISGYTAERFAKIMQLNVDAVMNGVLAVVDIMKEQGGGCILNTSSMVSFCGQPGGVGPHGNGVGAALHFPLAGLHIEIAERLVVQRNGYRLDLPGIQRDLGKALQLHRRTKQGAVLHAHIDLGHLGPGPLAGIGQREGDLLLPYLQI